jgi:hypothetical protein
VTGTVGKAHTRCVVRDDAEVLRRRLYAPGASATDVARYRDLGAVPTGPHPADPVRAPRRRSHALLVPLVVLALIAGGVGVARVAAHDTAAPFVAVVLPPTRIPLPSADRESVRDALASGDDVAVAAFLGAHRAPPALATATRSQLVEQSGTGSATVDLDAGSAATFQGRATVLLVLDRSAEVGWTTFRRAVDDAGLRTLERQQRRRGTQEAGGLTADTYRYSSGDRPVEIRVDAPSGVRWAVEVVFTD